MQYENALRNMLLRRGYETISGTGGLYWRLWTEGKIWILQLVPEHLPGQPRISLEERDRQGREVERRQMISENCQTERQMLILLSGPPSENEIQELGRYPHAWYLDKKNGSLYLYENQRGDFCHLRADLESLSEEYVLKKREYDRAEMMRIFTPVNTGLIIVNVLVFLALSFIGNTEDAAFMAGHGALSFDAVVREGEYYRFLTSMFIHFGASHLLQNMVILAVLGRRLERLAGSLKYLVLYLVSGLAASGMSFYFTLAGNPYMVSGGASGAVFGVMGGLLALIVKSYVTGRRKNSDEIGLRGMIFMIICAMSYGFTAVDVDNAAHIGGLIAGFVFMGLLDLLPDRR